MVSLGDFLAQYIATLHNQAVPATPAAGGQTPKFGFFQRKVAPQYAPRDVGYGGIPYPAPAAPQHPGFNQRAGGIGGGSAFGQNNIQAASDRYGEIARRGTADPTLSNIATAIRTGLGIAGPLGPISTMLGLTGLRDRLGLGSILGLTTNQPLGTSPYTGYNAIQGNPQTLAEFEAARARSRAEVAANREIARAGRPGRARSLSARSGGPRGGGNYGGSYGAGDRTSVGPGGTLGHI